MPDFHGIDNVYLTLLLVVPGLIIVYVRAQLISSRRISHTDNILGYLTLSFVYYALTLPILEWLLDTQIRGFGHALAWIGLTFAGPAAFGALLGIAAQKEWGISIANKFQLNTVHVIPTAWDWRFSKMPADGVFVMVTLSNGESVAGYFGTRSFASSENNERDLYLEEEYEVSSDGTWNPRGQKVGILIPAKEIRYVEIWEQQQEPRG